MQDLSHADRHDTRGALHNTSRAWSGGLNSGIYQDGSLHVTSHNHSHLAPFLMSQIPRRLRTSRSQDHLAREYEFPGPASLTSGDL